MGCRLLKIHIVLVTGSSRSKDCKLTHLINYTSKRRATNQWREAEQTVQLVLLCGFIHWRRERWRRIIICLMFFLSVCSIDFTILSEDGNYDHWKYSARYEEFLLYFPYIRYFIDGHFNVKPAGGGTYIIQSTHNTCFLSGLFCCMYAGFIHVAYHSVEVIPTCLYPKPHELNRFQ